MSTVAAPRPSAVGAGAKLSPRDTQGFFPIKRRRTYLNSASIAPMSLPVIEAVDSFMADVRDNGRNNYPNWCHQVETDIKQRIGLDEVEKPERPAARDRLYCGHLGGVAAARSRLSVEVSEGRLRLPVTVPRAFLVVHVLTMLPDDR